MLCLAIVLDVLEQLMAPAIAPACLPMCADTMDKIIIYDDMVVRQCSLCKNYDATLHHYFMAP
jgi:hypothetical protein